MGAGARGQVQGELEEGREEPREASQGRRGEQEGLWGWPKKVGSPKEGPGEASFGGPGQALGTLLPVFGFPRFLSVHTQSHFISFFPLLFLPSLHPPFLLHLCLSHSLSPPKYPAVTP